MLWFCRGKSTSLQKHAQSPKLPIPRCSVAPFGSGRHSRRLRLTLARSASPAKGKGKGGRLEGFFTWVFYLGQVKKLKSPMLRKPQFGECLIPMRGFFSPRSLAGPSHWDASPRFHLQGPTQTSSLPSYKPR